MKNLKKVLALVLAFACAFTMFAGAAFTDQADFAVDAEVVDTLVALGVIDGYDDGSFRPEATVTRAEMAKMIYVVRTGKSDASAYNDDVTSFTDINDHWARGYIKYCQSLGIIAGKSATTFDPDANVTTQEAAKMLLVTLGYNADAVGLTGNGWGNRTIALADENGLLKDVNCGTTAAAPRQFAAQLIYNTIFAETVVVRDGEYTNMNALGTGFNMTVGEKYMDLQSSGEQILTAVSKESNRDTYTVTLKNGAKFTRVTTDYTGLLGQEVKVMYKNNDTSKVYGVFAVEDSVVVAEGTVGQLEDVASNSNKTKLAGTEYTIESPRVYVANIYDTADDVTVVLPTLESATSKDVVAGTVKLIDNDGNGKVDTVMYTPATVAKVTYAGSTTVTMDNGLSAFDRDDLDIYEGAAKGDWVTVTKSLYTTSGDTTVSKIDVTTARVTSTKGTDPNQEVAVDGTWYKVAAAPAGDVISAGKDYDLVIVANYIVNATQSEAASTDVLFVADFDGVAQNFQTSGSTQDVKAYFLDGHSEVITVEKINGTDVSSGNKIDRTNVSTLYTYTKRSSGNYELKLLNNTTNKAGYEAVGTYGAGSYDANTNKLIGAGSAYYTIADDAVVFVGYGAGAVKADVKVLSGKTVKDWNTDYADHVAYATKIVNGIEYVKAMVLLAPSAYSGAGSSYQYAYMTGDSFAHTNTDGDNCTAYPVWTGTEVTTLYVDGAGASKNAGEVIAYSVDGDFITLATDVVVARVAITGYEAKTEGSVAFNGYNIATDAVVNKVYTMHEDCAYIAVDDDNQASAEGSSIDNVAIAEESSATPGSYYANAYLVLDKTSWDILAIVYDNGNRLSGNVLIP